MSNDWIKSLSADKLDIFKELVNIGAGNAATSLATILTDRVEMTVPELKILDLKQMANELGGPESPVAGVLFKMDGDIEGMIMFILEKKFCHTLTGILLDKHINSFEDLDELDLSMFREIGNIIVGGYVNALASMLEMQIKISHPDLAIDMAGAILSYPAHYFGTMGDSVLFVREDFLSDSSIITSHLLIMPQPESFDKIFIRLEEIYGG